MAEDMNNKEKMEMITSVTFDNFRGLSSVEVPLSQITMLTGTNGVGKTSVLEGLYCLFSETRLDVSPLSRYNRTVGFIINQANNAPIGVAARQNYNYRLFWEECPTYDKAECSVSARTDSNLMWSWKYKKANISDLDKQMTANSPMPVDSSTEFALWSWRNKGVEIDKRAHKMEQLNFKVERAQILSPDGGLYLLPPISQANSVCRYLDFASLRVQPNKLSYAMSKKLTDALKIINSKVTDVRLTDVESGLSVVLEDKYAVSLGTIGNGSVTWASALISIFDTIENTKFNLANTPPPVLFLIDEMGAGVHYSVMLNMWKYIREFSRQYPYIQFVTTSHSDDCVRSFCEAFVNDDLSRIVRLHKTTVGNETILTSYDKEQYLSIISGDWEVRG